MADPIDRDRLDPAVASAPDEHAALDAHASRRFRIALALTAAMMTVYFGFILLVAFRKDLFGDRLTEGLGLGILLCVLVIVKTLGNDSSLFPLESPALVSMPLMCLTGIVASLLAPERRAEERFFEAERQIHLGTPAAAPPPTAAARPVPSEP
jgi:uncharacterized membrane protein (DUF485 family)